MINDMFSFRLRELRENRHLNRTTLGELCGIGKNAIGQYERQEKTPTLKTLLILADYFQVSLDYLVGRQENPKNNPKR